MVGAKASFSYKHIADVAFIILSVTSVNISKFKYSLRRILFACEMCLSSWQDLHLAIIFPSWTSPSSRSWTKSYFHKFSLSASGELFKNVCWLLFLITSLTDPNTQKFSLEYIYRLQSSCFSIFTPFWPALCHLNSFLTVSDIWTVPIFSSINSTFIENRRETRYFKLPETAMSVYSSHTVAVAPDIAWFSRGWFARVHIGTILRAVKKPFWASLSEYDKI